MEWRNIRDRQNQAELAAGWAENDMSTISMQRGIVREARGSYIIVHLVHLLRN